MMMRPSNSGTATCVATSSGDRPSSDSAQSLRLVVRHSPCRIGTSSPASLRTSQPSSSPPAEAFAGRVPPAASTVVIRASYVPRCSMRSSGASRREAAKTGTPTPPASSIASARAETYAVFPAVNCAR